jgi:hypothetical protein
LIVDLHAHYAMHLVPRTAGTPIDLFSTARPWPYSALWRRGFRCVAAGGSEPSAKEPQSDEVLTTGEPIDEAALFALRPASEVSDFARSSCRGGEET